MKRDYVLPSGNEQEFILLAEKLGIEELVFVYPEGATPPTLKSESIKISVATLVRAPPKKKLSGEVIYTPASVESSVFERGGVHLVYGLEKLEEKDALNQRHSGFNQVLAKLAAKRNIAVGFFIDAIRNCNPKEQARILGRMSQNLRLCRKHGVTVVFGTMAHNPFDLKNPSDVQAFFDSL